MKYTHRIIEETGDYTIVEVLFKGEIVNIKYCSDDFCEFRFNDAFCRAWGYKDREDWLERNPRAKRQMLQFLGHIPDWVTFSPDIGFGLSKMAERPSTKFGRVSLN